MDTDSGGCRSTVDGYRVLFCVGSCWSEGMMVRSVALKWDEKQKFQVVGDIHLNIRKGRNQFAPL
jgi:hypothetical protein